MRWSGAVDQWGALEWRGGPMKCAGAVLRTHGVRVGGAVDQWGAPTWRSTGTTPLPLITRSFFVFRCSAASLSSICASHSRRRSG